MLPCLYNAYKNKKYIGARRELIQLNCRHQGKVIISTIWSLLNGLEVWSQIPENQVNTDMHTQSYYMIGSMNKLEANQILRGNTIVSGNWSLTIFLLGFTSFSWVMLSNEKDRGL